MIISSAVKLKDGRTFVGKRHGDCYVQMKELGLPKEDCNNGATQGFINDQLQFLNREEAYYEALFYNQCKKKEKSSIIYARGLEIKKWKPLLMSEDLW